MVLRQTYHQKGRYARPGTAKNRDRYLHSRTKKPVADSSMAPSMYA